jgi:hypothetical protein
MTNLIILFRAGVYKKGLNRSQALYGILLGYGTENGLGFEEYYSVKRDVPAKNVVELNDNEDTPLLTPHFASFSKKETQRLIREYRRQRRDILKRYSKGDFLEITLSRLTSRSI